MWRGPPNLMLPTLGDPIKSSYSLLFPFSMGQTHPEARKVWATDAGHY